MLKATLYRIPNCDFCSEHGLEILAVYDCPTVFGPWAYVCQGHYVEQGSPKHAAILLKSKD